MKILAVETSCDETAVALLAFSTHDGTTSYRILDEKLHSQVALHNQYGGVFPTLAKREHQKILPFLTKKLLETSTVMEQDATVNITDTLQEICSREPDMLNTLTTAFTGVRPLGIDALTVTKGPGLAPALWVGVNFVKALSLLWNIPIIPINHMEGHIVSALTTDTTYITPTYPLLALLVSGGHTELVLATQPHAYEKIGKTLDDAAGEAFDKVARLLGLPYPGGPEIATLAQRARTDYASSTVSLPRPMLQDDSLNFSYAGLKTAVRTLVEKKSRLSDNDKAEIALEFENAVVETLAEKTRRAITQHTPRSVVVSGGVSANTHLRNTLQALVEPHADITLYLPDPKRATDNAVMVALTGYIHQEHTVQAMNLSADANLSFPEKKTDE